jgi:hypothetical protein
MTINFIFDDFLVGICNKDEIEKLSKTELTSSVKEMLKLCELCVDNNCECVQLGVPCSAEVYIYIYILYIYIYI